MRRKVFISYSHKDEHWRAQLVEQLSVLEMAGLLTLWDDTRIGAGQDWYEQINKAMLDCRVAFMLISASFLSSKFILKEEVPELIHCHEEDGMSVIPLLVRPCPWKVIDWLAKLQLRPADGSPLAGRQEADVESILADVAYEALEMLKLGDTDSLPSATGIREGADL